MENKTAIRLNRYIDSMPSLSITVAKILEVTRNPQVTAKDLNKVINLDPVLMGRVLKLVNSAYYGLSNKVTSLVTAIIMLGINTIKNLALSTAILGRMKNKKKFKALNVDGFWRHSIGVGVASKLIAEKIGVPTNLREEFFIAGLLHDIGKIPMNDLYEEPYMRAIRDADLKKRRLVEVEEEVLGITHTQVGKMIAEKWNLTEETTDAILHHHDPNMVTGDTYNVVAAVYAANKYCNMNEVGFSGDRYPGDIDTSVLEMLGISEDFLDELFDRISAEIEKASVFLQVS
jgi:putative nucleotidyltransferase with HDIG domain